jgi:glycosyltransferase involved in cell wall biosynthesis
MLEPRISVVIPTKNRKQETVRAIQSVLAQQDVTLKIIVVDDGSTDDTADYISGKYPQVTLVRNTTSKGGAKARNDGAACADGDYIAFLDSDDEWLPHHLKTAIATMREQHADGVFGPFFLAKGEVHQQVEFSSPKNPSGKVGDLIFSFQRFDARTSTFVFRREAFNAVRFDDDLRKHQDWDLAIRFDAAFVWAVSNEPTVLIHIPSSGRMSSSLNHEATRYFLKKHARAVKPDSIFAFCLKQIMRSQRAGEAREIVEQYLDVISPLLSKLSWKNRMVYWLVKTRMLNVGLVYKIRRKISPAS